MADKYSLDLVILTRADIYAQALPCITAKAAVEAGLLSAVNGYERFVSEM